MVLVTLQTLLTNEFLSFTLYFSCHFSEFSSISHSYQMAPSVCQNSPKLPPHNNTQSGVHSGGGGAGGGGVVSGVGGNSGGGGIGIGGAGGSSSITQRSNCGSSSINGSMASYKMSTTSETSWSQTVFSKVSRKETK